MKVVIASNHHREVPYHNKGIELLKSAGYEVIFQDTHGISYDQGMMQFKSILPQFDIVVFIDNDLFLSGLTYFNTLLEDFIKGKYGFCSYFENGSPWHYTLEGSIAPVTDQQFIDVPDEYKFKPLPHWENAYMFITKEVYDALTVNDLANSRNMIKAIYQTGTKMGAHKAEYRLTYSHCGPEWFHVGNLMKYYYVMERMDFSDIKWDSLIDMSRIGLLLAQRNDFGRGVYSGEFNVSLDMLVQQKGEQFFLEKWNQLYKI